MAKISLNSGSSTRLHVAALVCLLSTGMPSMALADSSDCSLTFDQLQATNFKSSLVVNGEKTRLANGTPLEPFQPIAKPTQIGFMPNNNRDIFFNEIYKGTIKKWDMEAKP